MNFWRMCRRIIHAWKKKSILLIEDEAEFREALRLRLETNGYNILEADNGVDGLALAQDRNPDLVLLDVRLPRLDGFQVAHSLKGDTQRKKIPVLILSALSQKKDIEMGLAMGADVYMTKPFQPYELLRTISMLTAV